MRDFERYGIDCKNQSSGVHTIQTPPPKLFGTRTNPSETSTDIAFENLLCPECRHVYAYSPQDVHQRLFRIGDQYLVPRWPTCVSVEFVCGSKGFKAPMKVHVLMQSEFDTRAVLGQLDGTLFWVHCPMGDIPQFDSKNLIHVEAIGPFLPF